MLRKRPVKAIIRSEKPGSQTRRPKRPDGFELQKALVAHWSSRNALLERSATADGTDRNIEAQA